MPPLTETARYILKQADEFVFEALDLRDRRLRKFFQDGQWVEADGGQYAGAVEQVLHGDIWFRSVDGVLYRAFHAMVEPAVKKPAPKRATPRKEE